MKTTPLLVLIAALTLMTLPVHADKPAFVADTIIVNAVVHTMDKTQPTAEAVAIYGNRIVAVGSTKDIKKSSLVQPRARSTRRSVCCCPDSTTRIRIS